LFYNIDKIIIRSREAIIMTTLKDVAEHAGVSISSVVRVLKGEKVSENVQRAVIKAKNELKYRMDLTTENSIQYRFVVYVGEMFSKGFFVLSVLEGLKEAAKKYNCEMVTMILGNSSFIKHEDVDGVIVVATNVDEEKKLSETYGELGIPILLVNRKCNFKNISYITIDHFNASYEGVKYLISLGHKKIAIIKGIENLEPNIERYEGCINAMEESGLKINREFILNGNNTEKQAYESVRRSLADNNRPTAIFALSDEMAIGTIKAIVDSGLKVPDDISVLGFDANDIFTYMNPSLSTIKVPGETMGALTMENLIAIIESEEILQQKTIVRHKIVLGNSTSRISTLKIV
jgi:DNA-binding LacI/PurR family transcriptional regulator